MKIFFSLLLLLSLHLHASQKCDTNLFSFDIGAKSSSVSIEDIVENLASQCSFSVVFSDKYAKKIVRSTSLGLLHIKNYSLDNMFEYLFNQNNLFYSYNKDLNILTISYLKTKSFTIDYVNLSEQTTKSTKNITVGAVGQQTDNSYGGGNNGNSNSANNNNSNLQNSGTNSDSTVVVTNTKFEFWKKLSNDINLLLSRQSFNGVHSRFIINREAGIVTVVGTLKEMHAVEHYLAKLKRRLHKEVLLDVKIIELRYLDQNSTGVNWSKFDFSIDGSVGNSHLSGNLNNPTLAAPTFSLNYKFSLNGLLRFLGQYGSVNILTQPKIMTLNNQAAVINVGNQINYMYQNGSVNNYNNSASTTSTYTLNSVFVGLTLSIVPEITDEGYIVLKINPVISEELKGLTNDNSSGSSSKVNTTRTLPPDIKIRQLSTIVKTKDRHPVLLGGLVSNKTTDIDTKVPLLNAIPLVGGLFKSSARKKEKVELIILVTPKIVKHQSFPSIEMIEKQIHADSKQRREVEK